MLKTRIITALVLLLVFLLALFLLPPLGWAVLVIGLVLQGTAEWARLAGLSAMWGRVYWGLTLLLMLGMLLLEYVTEPVWWRLIIYGLAALLWLIIVPLWLMAGVRTRQPVLLAIIGWLVLLPAGLAMMDLRAHTPYLLLGVMGLVWMADIAAYFSGRKFGKHKLAPTISPGKTWEGVIGAVLGVSLYIVLVASASALFPTHKLTSLLLISWMGVALAVLGDLFESAIKRQAGVKDSGAILPGHGGLLDRIDALTAALPLAALGMLIQGGSWVR